LTANADRPRLIRAYKHGWPRIAVDRMIRRKLVGGLNRVRAQGLAAIRAEIDRDPSGTLFLANHSCWWDLFLVHLLNGAIPVDGYGMMEHFNMLRFGFFRRIGAFSVDRTDPRSVRASLAYVHELLNHPRAGVWIFPQGRLVGNDVRPLGFQPGLRALIRRAGGIRVVPVAFRFEFWQDERPEAFVRFGSPARFGPDDRSTVLDACERSLTAELDALKVDVTAQAVDRFEVIFAGKASTSDRYARARARVAGPTRGAPD